MVNVGENPDLTDAEAATVRAVSTMIARRLAGEADRDSITAELTAQGLAPDCAHQLVDNVMLAIAMLDQDKKSK